MDALLADGCTQVMRRRVRNARRRHHALFDLGAGRDAGFELVEMARASGQDRGGVVISPVGSSAIMLDILAERSLIMAGTNHAAPH